MFLSSEHFFWAYFFKYGVQVQWKEAKSLALGSLSVSGHRCDSLDPACAGSFCGSQNCGVCSHSLFLSLFPGGQCGWGKFLLWLSPTWAELTAVCGPDLETPAELGWFSASACEMLKRPSPLPFSGPVGFQSISSCVGDQALQMDTVSSRTWSFLSASNFRMKLSSHNGQSWLDTSVLPWVSWDQRSYTVKWHLF